jgi:hypothetical protein
VESDRKQQRSEDFVKRPRAIASTARFDGIKRRLSSTSLSLSLSLAALSVPGKNWEAH